ncbi:hypothetical protein [Falsiphaeobacter marinintestinus]|uniref:hypothetical protein n=1 Tax=Falsiphaeobacter marinintestinus TaxID=1492905 RepID=UPI0011B61360|nr:hypothetical protein [Phaeobacter marinintestinus]
MSNRQITAAPDYTLPALVMMGVNLTWVFFVIWAMWGLLPVIVMGLILNHAITRLEDRRRR